jgi:hypothetical protein
MQTSKLFEDRRPKCSGGISALFFVVAPTSIAATPLES